MRRFKAPANVTGIFCSSGREIRADENGFADIDPTDSELQSLFAAGFSEVFPDAAPAPTKAAAPTPAPAAPTAPTSSNS